MQHRIATKTALAFSVIFFIVWILLGANATVAWFTDTTQVKRNTFVIGEMDLDVSYRQATMERYAPVTHTTKVFNEAALYEPGYTQVVYLQVTNNGNVAFDYKLSVDVTDYNTSTNQHGKSFCLPPHLRFGVVFGDSEVQLERELAQAYAGEEMGRYKDHPLNIYSQMDPVPLAAGQSRYVAVVVYMPETVGNEANYQKGAPVPYVELGLTVFAQQAGTMK